MDRKLGRKFRTPYEPGVWTISRATSTMIMAQRANETVSRNISWFRKVTFKEPQTTEPDLIYPHPEPESDILEPQCARDKALANGPGAPSSPEDTQSETQDEGHWSQT
ncbi:hypothetical protein NDU88_007713 [Pleurodeles waltl]|uniref:Uncharacterized protein n=1 Tax=Pleurodeles waltl TaxID=8319 RepID=A0AAV7U162_PLEWA|nr:hypothetical protein NDU88_007713 [Pleurodeles waltl]